VLFVLLQQLRLWLPARQKNKHIKVIVWHFGAMQSTSENKAAQRKLGCFFCVGGAADAPSASLRAPLWRETHAVRLRAPHVGLARALLEAGCYSVPVHMSLSRVLRLGMNPQRSSKSCG
jgi:hypothetical protein